MTTDLACDRLASETRSPGEINMGLVRGKQKEIGKKENATVGENSSKRK